MRTDTYNDTNIFLRITSVLLIAAAVLSCLGLFVYGSPQPADEDDTTQEDRLMDILSIPVVSDLDPDMEKVDYIVYDSEIYIQSSSAERFSGFTVTSQSEGEVVFEKVLQVSMNGYKIEYECNCEKYVCNNVIKYEDARYSLDGDGFLYYLPDIFWVPLTPTLEELYTEFDYLQGILTVSGREWTPLSALAYIDYIVFGDGNGMNDPDGFDIAKSIGYDPDSFDTKHELFKAALWDEIVEWKLIEQATSAYEKNQYEKVFYDVLKIDDELSEWLSDEKKLFKSIKTTTKNINSISKAVLTASAALGEEKLITDVTDMDEVIEFFATTDNMIVDFAGLTYKSSKKVNELIDFAGTAIKSATGLEIKGLDIVSQLSLVLNYNRLLNCTEQASNSILLTYYYDGELRPYIRPAGEEFIKRLYELKTDPSSYNSGRVFIEEELKTVVEKTVVSTIEKFVEDHILDAVVGAGTTIYTKAATAAVKVIANDILHLNASEYFSWVNLWPILVDLQDTAKTQYWNYRNSFKMNEENSILNAKYSALLYLKLFLLNNKYESDVNVSSILYDIDRAGVLFSQAELASAIYACIADISDGDLMGKGSNKNLSLDDFFLNAQISVGFSFTEKYNGSGYAITGIGKCLDKKLIFPSEYNGLPVIEIEEGAFKNCSTITSVYIPSSIKKIGVHAFYSCDNLETVSLKNGLKIIGHGAFYGCHKLNNIIVPEGVFYVGNQAFSFCTNLSVISFPNSVIYIGSSILNETSYYNDSKNWKDNVLYIDNALIKANDNIAGDYYIKGETKVIAESAFSNCTKLTGINLPDGILSVGAFAFYDCVNLSKINIPDSVVLIQCQIVENTLIDLAQIEWDSENWGKMSGPYYIGKHLIRANDNLLASDYTIDSNTKTIGGHAFYACDSLLSVTIPGSVSSIGEFAFYNCDNLKRVTICENVSYIANNAFYNCKKLESVVIPRTVKFIGNRAFGNCDNLKTIYFEGSEEEWWEILRDGIIATSKNKVEIIFNYNP